jgi:uncharacterized cofD-like protein
MKKNEQNQRRLVGIGGGGGISQILLGAHPHFAHLTAIVGVTDTGRSTGIARALANMPAPGDLRNTLARLARDPNDLFPTLIQHRFHSEAVPSLEGMAFGNLLIAALTEVTGDFARAVEIVAELVACPHQVLPVSVIDTNLCAELEDGCIMQDELAVRGLNKAPIRRLFLANPDAVAYPPVIQALGQADVIVLGPGSFFTSVMATLLFQGVCEALQQTAATIVFICNTTTQPGQTDDFRVVDHVERLVELVGRGVIDVVLVNRSEDVSPAILEQYAADGVHLLQPDDEEIARIAALGVRPVVRDYAHVTEGRRKLWNKQDTIRHDPARVGETLWEVVTGYDKEFA